LENRLKFQFPVFALILILCTGSLLAASLSTTKARTLELDVIYDATHDGTAPQYQPDKSTIKVLSLNLAHGRGDSFTQFFVSGSQIRHNLSEIADFLKRENADIVTLQEADAPSRWSGKFNHVEFLAREAGYPWYTHAHHVSNWFGTYGTAVMSRFPIIEGYGINFKPTPPSTKKGFTLAEIEWRSGQDNGERIVIDVVSVHLDFARRSKRIDQIEEMNKVLKGRANPAIVLGDFNNDWVDGARELQVLAEKIQLTTHRPEANHLVTYFEDRFDWILISEEFNFCNYYAAPDILSDHLAVVSEIVTNNSLDQTGQCSKG
jgi:endonuclease/exonuclease/phosphatase family metal-dependent hydrolase